MATTNKGIYYPNNYSNVADVPEDMKKLAESVDTQISNLDTNKVDKVDGKGLSTNDYTNEDKAKLDGLENYDDTEIKQDIEDIQEEQAKQNEDIEDLKQNDAKQDELIQKLKDNSINVTTEEATSLHVTDASTLPARLEVRGNHSQKTREGYNIWDYLSAVLSSAGGLTIEKDYENGYITVNGMPSKDYVSIVSTAYITNLLEDGQRYTLWQENYQNEETAGIYLQVARTADNETTVRYYSKNNSASFLVDKSNNASYSITLQTSSVDGTGTLTNYRNRYMLYKGTDEKSYKLPGASPSLDYPSEVRAVGDNVNVLPNNAVSTSHNGVNYTINEDGSIYAVGTATSNSQVILAGQMSSTEEIMKLRKGVQYKNVGNVDIIYRDTNLDYARLQEGNILTVDENVSVGCFYLQVNSGTTVDETYYPKLVEYYEGMDESYSPYGQGSVEVKKVNKNWAKIDTPHTVERSGLNIEVDNEGVFTLNGTTTANMYINLINIEEYQNTTLTNYKLPLKKYKAYFDLIQKNNSAVSESNGDASFNIRNFAASSTGEQVISYCVFGGLIKGNTGVQIKDCNITDNRIVTHLYVANGVKLDNFKFRFALYNEDETDTTYEKYEESSYILDIQKPMLLGDYFVKEADGWKEVHTWNKVVLTGNENSWSWNTDNFQRVSINVANGLNNPGRQMIYSNNFIYGASGNNVGIGFLYASRLYLYYPENITSLEDWKALLQEKYNSGNPVYVYYPLATSTKLPCTEAQSNVLDQLNELELFKGTNNIITAEGLALMQMQYIADTETYIDNKIDEKLANINQQILELAGGN